MQCVGQMNYQQYDLFLKVTSVMEHTKKLYLSGIES